MSIGPTALPDPAAPAPISTCAVAVDVAMLTVHDGELQLLLVQPDAGPFTTQWALPGRRVRDDESLDDTANRALRELAGLAAPDAHLEQLRTYGDPTRDPRGRVVSVAYLALTPTFETVVADGPLATGRAAFFDVGRLTDDDGPQLAYDHDRIVPDAIERARSKLEYTSLATAFVAEPFTLGELRRVYEAVWGVELDAANFRRKVVSTRDFVVEVEGTSAPGPGGGRPAKRYRRGRASRLHPAMLRP
ncbi:NUDIX domain-containing protein [Egicoccus sp. AB-alg6-2]|uniref:NUDIX hydrolase n=1 Tax=Egicoccus sp. AB-alg6-2 TaxID=3242692 RepID=UPI00359DE0A3